ncbi:MAG: hypothetical protein L0220_07860, partial [Acidobacteria bacterium]|nr:hypothetical protein [Acidobacteriota bacterium]
SDGSSWLSCARIGSAYALRFSGMADFLISPDRRLISCHTRGAPQETIRHLFLDQVLPRLLAGRDRVVLHASAVVVGNEAIAFLGDSGQGKSTISVSLASLSGFGRPLITDDSLLLHRRGERIYCVPSYPGVRLWDESVSALFEGSAAAVPVAHYFDKSHLNATENHFAFASEEVPLRKIYLLSAEDSESAPEDISITPVAPGEVFGKLLDSCYRLEIDDARRIREEFETLSLIASEVQFARLSYPHDFSLLHKTQCVILEDFVGRFHKPDNGSML